MPAGLIFLFFPMTDVSLFLVVYGVTAVYFSGIMTRLLLVMSPAACSLAAIGLSELLTGLGRAFSGQVLSNPEGELVEPNEKASVIETERSTKPLKSSKGKGNKDAPATTPITKSRKIFDEQTLFLIPKDVSVIIAGFITFGMLYYLVHSIYMAADIYSSPSIVMQSRDANGGTILIDDYREAYTWLRSNTNTNARIASWWGK